MKRIILATVLGLATVGSASAMTDTGRLSGLTTIKAERILPGASFDNLTVSQAAQIEGALAGGQDNAGVDL
ncbi:hypothetical protein EGN72_00135, partial [Pseudorhodobacter sp. E13]|uniref:NAD-glutamate dehydrogenase n=1 Tax=Pseudorhodobacter sp. E13 TaxID=2487931 RepID=UPI000FA79659